MATEVCRNCKCVYYPATSDELELLCTECRNPQLTKGLANYRVTCTRHDGTYTQRDFRSLRFAELQITSWVKSLSLVTGEKLTMTFEVL